MAFGRKAKKAVVEDVKPVKKFPPTKEQQECIDMAKVEDFCKISAFAGTGKSATLVMVSEEVIKPSLYLAYNKSMAEEAKDKFPSHVECRTVHSIAYQRVGRSLQHKLSRPRGKYVNVAGTGKEVGIFFRIPDISSQNSVIKSSYLGLIIRDTVDAFEYSADEKVNKKNIPYQHLKDIEKRFPDINIEHVKKMVVRYARQLWEERTSSFSEVLARHDTYLKVFQLRKMSVGDYDVLYGDEFQDINPCALDIFNNQKDMKKVIVGDKFQSIYRFRSAINALANVEAPEKFLTKSFRFGKTIAWIGNVVLQAGTDLKGFENIESKAGLTSVIDFDQPHTYLFRTNMNLIFTAVDLLTKGEEINVHFDTRDFTELLKSCRALKDENYKMVKHENIVPYNNWEEFCEEGEQDAEFKRLISIIENDDDERVLEVLHSYKAKGGEKITLTTAHKSKGLEYKQVILADDFPSNYNHKGEWKGLNEDERNLLYVACTRAVNALQYNNTVQEIIDAKVGVERPEGVNIIEHTPADQGLVAEVKSIKEWNGAGFVQKTGNPLVDAVAINTDQEFLDDMKMLGNIDEMDSRTIDQGISMCLDKLTKW